MERELWAELSKAICDVDATWRDSPRFTHRTALVVRVHLWAALHDRPVSWACDPESWDARTRPPALPDQSTLSRRARRKGPAGFEAFLDALAARLSGGGGGARPAPSRLVKRFDGKALAVASHSTDRDAAWGRGVGGLANGYKLHALWAADDPFPLDWAVTPLDVDETRMAARFLTRLDEGGGYVLGDTRHDSSWLYRLAAGAGHQLVAPRRRGPGGADPGGLGHRKRCRSPARVRGIEMLEPPAGINPFGRALHNQRRQIERDFGNLVSFGGGLSGLPAWVRRIPRVRRWVYAKLLINAARIKRLRRAGA
jgi:hypothetical protein